VIFDENHYLSNFVNIRNKTPIIMLKKLSITAFALLLLTSCDAVDELTKFDLDYTTNYTIESNTIIDTPLDIITPEVTTNSETEFESNDTRKDLIESIKLKTMTLTLKSPSDGNFNFINEISIYIKAEGLAEQIIASGIDLPENGAQQLTLGVDNVELKEYIKKDSYSLRVNTVTDGAITRDHNIDIRTVFRVDAKILGI
tara:strand:+ start:618 stop:1217 length:600 start_codon:yes stop_codon:yes gene_type:complete